MNIDSQIDLINRMFKADEHEREKKGLKPNTLKWVIACCRCRRIIEKTLGMKIKTDWKEEWKLNNLYGFLRIFIVELFI